mmetsp:Transcript_45359/g.68406  ORF Transcript_45359/g.68406 Transcript_45359/m.68406 type:complete len:94 (+) Transcript_45359:676-957(+)
MKHSLFGKEGQSTFLPMKIPLVNIFIVFFSLAVDGLFLTLKDFIQRQEILQWNHYGVSMAGPLEKQERYMSVRKHLNIHLLAFPGIDGLTTYS